MPGPSNASNRFGPSSYIVGTPANGLGNGVNFTSIQAAVNQAVADGFGVANPVDIVIRAGVYTEDVTITDGGISLVGVSDAPNNLLGQQTFINGTISLVITGLNQFALSNLFVGGVLGPALSVTGGATPLRMSADNCTFSSLAAATPGVSFTNASGTLGLATFTGCSLISSLAEAHFSSARTVSTFFNCNLRGSTNMITLDGTARVQLLYSVGNANAGFGVQFLNAGNQVAACRFSTIAATDSIVDMTVGGTSTLEHCTFSSGALSGFFITGTGNLIYTDLVNTGLAIDLDPALGTITVGDWKPYAQPGVGPAPSLGTVRGTSCFDNTQFTVTDGFVELVGGVAAGTFPVDNGGPGVPLLGAMSFLGSTSVDFPNPSGIETHVGATTNQIYFEDRRWVSPLIVDSSATIGLRGTFTTITAALAAATAGQTIYVRPGTYTEDITMVANVSVIGLTGSSIGLAGSGVNQVILEGTISAPVGGGSTTVQNLRIRDGAGTIGILSNDAGSSMRVVGCSINTTGFCIQMQDGIVDLDNCYLSSSSNAIEYDTNNGPTVRANDCRMDSAVSAIKIDTSSTFFCRSCLFVNSAGNVLEATLVGVNVEFVSCQLISNGVNAIDISGGGSLSINFCEVNSPGASAIEFGAGGATVRSFHNTYNSAGPEYVTGTVGTYEFGDDIINPAASAGIAAAITKTNYGWRPWAESGVGPAPSAATIRGTSCFDSASFQVTDGFVELSGTAVANSFPTDSGTATPVAGVINVLGGAGVTTSAAGNTITIDAVAWTTTAGAFGPANDSGTFTANAAGTIVVTLDATPGTGSVVKIVAVNTGFVAVTAPIGTTIQYGNQISSAGGALTSTDVGDTLDLVSFSNTAWFVQNSVGNWTVS